MSDLISFRPLDAALPDCLRIVMTSKSFSAAEDIAGDVLRMLTALSGSSVLMMVAGKREDEVRIQTPKGSLICKPSDAKDTLVAINFYKNSLFDQNRAMKFGVCFQVTRGIVVQIKLTSHNYFCELYNGTRYENISHEHLRSAATVKKILEQMALSREKSGLKEEAEREAQYQPEKRLSDLLQVAESYSILSSSLEKQKARAMSGVFYSNVSAVEYDRLDRVVYEFAVEGLDENTFKAGVQVEISDTEQDPHNAEIVELVKEDPDTPATAVRLMFNEQVGIDRFARGGFFSLSFSTVNRDVQLAANEKIRTGQAKARYMDAIFGTNTTAGFENKDLSKVMAALDAKEYPPNKSQKNAITAGINTKDVFLVMGPPGTGKTTVILEWVKYFVLQEHKRVLVSSQNNKAVDNVLARVGEEEDIDIIRIGSETKVQADVSQFLFENKIVSLRQQIVSDTRGHQQVLDGTVALWERFAREMDAVSEKNKKTEQDRQIFIEEGKKTILPMYKTLQEQRRQAQKIHGSKHELAERLTALARRLKRHEDATNSIVRFFTGIFYKGRLKKLRKLWPEYRQLERQDAALVASYTEHLQIWQQALDALEQGAYRVYRETELCFRQALLELKQPQRLEGDIWDPYSSSRACPCTDTEHFAALKQQIAADKQRALALGMVITDWKTDMGEKQNYALNEIILEMVNVVGATCIGINSQKRFADLDFDVTIIDEAGQIQIHNALVPMSVSNKLIMLGDHKQIPPSVDAELVELCRENGVRPDLLEMSLFEKMYRELPPSNKMMLDTQYRMPGEIADTISEWFYEGAYFSPGFKRGLPSRIPRLSDKPYLIIDTSAEPNRRERPIEGAGCDNALEADIIASVIRYLHSDLDNLPLEEQKKRMKEIGVISAYKSQVKLIKNKLSGFLDRSIVSEMAATLDSYQGQERDIILYSFTKSADKDPFRRRIGFLNELRRLNVAMTRCKKMLILIGDMEFLSGCKHCDHDEDGKEIYDKSERQFSDFIAKMLADVRGGRGELISYREFVKRMKGGEQ